MKKQYFIMLTTLTATLVWLGGLAYAQQPKLTCGPKKSIGGSLASLKPGDTLFVSGTCTENLLIPEEVRNVILDGQGTATISPIDATENTIRIRGRGITIRGFTINGGFRAIALQNGGAAILTQNTIQGVKHSVSK
jgi:hypothetical protein